MKVLKSLLTVLALFTLLGNAQSQKVQQGTLTVCENTDDNVYAINPKTVVKVGEPVVFLIDFGNTKYREGKDKERDQFFISWEVYKIDSDGKDEKNLTELQQRSETLYKRYAIDQFQTFSEPGKYRVYALPWEMRDINFKSGNYKDYFGKTEIEVVE
jgi:hypothetical protein